MPKEIFLCSQKRREEECLNLILASLFIQGEIGD
jgi:hypothetical protein